MNGTITNLQRGVSLLKDKRQFGEDNQQKEFNKRESKTRTGLQIKGNQLASHDGDWGGGKGSCQPLSNKDGDDGQT